MLSHRFALKGTELSLSALLTVLGDFEVLFNFFFFLEDVGMLSIGKLKLNI